MPSRNIISEKEAWMAVLRACKHISTVGRNGEGRATIEGIATTMLEQVAGGIHANPHEGIGQASRAAQSIRTAHIHQTPTGWTAVGYVPGSVLYEMADGSPLKSDVAIQMQQFGESLFIRKGGPVRRKRYESPQAVARAIVREGGTLAAKDAHYLNPRGRR